MFRAARPLLALTLLALAAASRAQEVVHDLIYMKGGGAAFTMDEFKPAKPNGMAVLWMVSGGWFSSHEAIDPNIAKGLNAFGITVFEVVHGSQPRYKIPEIEGQIVRAVRYVRANATTLGINPDQIGIAGGSAGGHLSLMAAGLGDDGSPSSKDPVERASSRVQAVVAYFPPTDFLNYGATGRVPTDDPQMAIFAPAFGVDPKGPRDAIETRLHDVSPINVVNPLFPPTLLVHGDKDTLVPLQQSQVFDAALEKAGRVHKLIVVKDGVHGGGPPFEPTYAELVKWFLTYLAKK